MQINLLIFTSIIHVCFPSSELIKYNGEMFHSIYYVFGVT